MFLKNWHRKVTQILHGCCKVVNTGWERKKVKGPKEKKTKYALAFHAESKKQTFEDEKGYYEKPLQASGYNIKICHKKAVENTMRKKSRKRKVIWVNPPWPGKFIYARLMLKSSDL